MDPITRAKYNRLRDPLLTIAIQQQQLTGRYEQIARSAGLGEAFIARRADKQAARERSKRQRAARRRNRA